MQVFKYVKGTRDFGISFSRLEDRQKVKGYVDSDYAGDCMDRKSTYKSVFMLLRGPLTWYSRKQRFVSTSIMEAEYVTLCYGSKEAMWFRELFKELGFV